jgi:hypothetical protein
MSFVSVALSLSIGLGATGHSPSAAMLRPGDERLAIEQVLSQPAGRLDLTMEADGAPVSPPIGSLIGELHLTTDGRVVRTQTIALGGRRQIDLSVATRDLTPVRHYSASSRRTVDFHFDPDGVTGFYAPADEAETAVDDPLREAAFDSNHIDLVARAIPLEPGFEAEAATYGRPAADTAPDETFVSYTVRYIGREDGLAIAGFRRTGAGSPETRVVFDPATRRLARLEAPAGPGRLLVMRPAE